MQIALWFLAIGSAFGVVACASAVTPTAVPTGTGAPTPLPTVAAPTSVPAPAPTVPAGTTRTAIAPTASAATTPTVAAVATAEKAAATSPTPAARVTATAAPAKPAAAATPRVETVARGLDTPWAIAFAPDGRMFITERPGRIRVVRDGQLQAEPWLEIDVAESGESGLMGLAFDPDFAQNRYVYVAYTDRAPEGGLRNRLVRLREDPATTRGQIDKVLVDSVRAASVHDGARVGFGPDGKLYWTMGDAADASLAQDRSSLNGKIMRLNPDGSIPADNPFPGSPVYSLGHRNPQGLAWQPETGRLYATEHGPSGGVQGCCRDEVNFIEPGKNYGWPLVTGEQTREEMVAPVIQSGTTTTWAPSGATFISRGPWTGSLVFVGLRGQALYRLTLDPSNPRAASGVETYFSGQYGRLRAATEGPDGALYVGTSNRDGRGNPAAEDDRILRLTFP